MLDANAEYVRLTGHDSPAEILGRPVTDWTAPHDRERNAREVASKFAQDSESTLGKIKAANQGQFSIEDRDSNTPHIKKIRVVSTVEYYLSD